MKRKLFETETRRLIEKIRTQLPDISLRTTFLLGYPGEKKAQFQKLIDFVQGGYFDYVGSFAFSPEEKTPAWKQRPRVSPKVQRERQHMLAEIQYEVALRKAKRRLGQLETVLFEEKEGRWVFGRTAKEAPEIDATVKMEGSMKNLNHFSRIKLIGFEAYEFSGKQI